MPQPSSSVSSLPRPFARIMFCGLLIAAWPAAGRGADPPRASFAPDRSRAAPEREKPTSETWQVNYLGKSRIGYSRSLSRPVVVEGKSLVKTENEMHLTFKRFGQTLRMEMRQDFEEFPNGAMSAFVFEMKNPPASSTLTTGRVQGNQLNGQTSVGGTVREYSMPWQPETRSPAYLDRLPREHRLEPGSVVTLQVFLPEQMQVSGVRISAGRRETVSLLDGRRQKLLKVTTTESLLPQSPVQSYLDEHGQVLVSTAELLGQTLTTYTVPAAEALKEVAGEDLDLALNTLVQSTVIPNAHQTRRAVYRVKMRGEDPTPFFPNEPNQKVIRTGRDECQITVRAFPPTNTNRSMRVDRQYLAESRYLQTTDPAVLMHADQAARAVTDPAQIAIAMEKYVHQQIRRKDFSTALGSAAEVAKSLQGDCTEHAVLLAAMLRVRNIPSRVAVGLVYIDALAAFGGHMWTEALLGDRWFAWDATLGGGGAAADRIKLADSSFADQGPAPMTTFLPLLRVLGRIQLTVVETSTQ